MIVLFIKGKLFQTENYIPVFSALSKYSKKKLLIIYPTKRSYLQIKSNTDIFRALESIAKVKHFYSRYDFFNTNSSKAIYDFFNSKEIEDITFKKKFNIFFYIYGLFSILQRNILLSFFLFKPVNLFYTDHIPFTNWLIKINSLLFKGKKISLLIYPYDFNTFKNLVLRVSQDSSEFNYSKKLLKMNTNTIISSYNISELKQINKDIEKRYKTFCIGSDIYLWPTWFKQLEMQAKNDINFLKQNKYIFFPLSIIKRISYTSRGRISVNFSDTICYLLNTVNAIDKNILVVIRPHPTTNLEELMEVLRKAKHKKIKIMTTNSIFLIQYCYFVMKYGISLMDPKAFYFNKICLRYHSKDLVEIFGPELTNSANNIKKNIYDITNKKIFHKYTIAAIKNKISKNPIKKKIPDEKDILKEIIKYLR